MTDKRVEVVTAIREFAGRRLGIQQWRTVRGLFCQLAALSGYVCDPDRDDEDDLLGMQEFMKLVGYEVGIPVLLAISRNGTRPWKNNVDKLMAYVTSQWDDRTAQQQIKNWLPHQMFNADNRERAAHVLALRKTLQESGGSAWWLRPADWQVGRTR